MNVERAGRFRDEDFLETWHDWCELEQAYRELLREFRRMEMRWSDTRYQLQAAETLAAGWRAYAEAVEQQPKLADE